MGLAGLYRRRRPVNAFALIGMVFYVLLFPWHTVSQTALMFGHAELALGATPICHGDAAPSTVPSKGPHPAKPTHCPICNGFAALQFALAGTATAMVLPPESGSAATAGSEDHLADALVPAPQSRGPPFRLT
jgi:hypothetical protein